ncbi:zinc ribbon domain-containing protein [Lactobacillus crispatus]|nr:zinc ribbon domain-containing protein [Lactobacillus crispatus]MCZ3643240.1 zinc ribbon domain-containing protein [Lactobacillus crispatus]
MVESVRTEDKNNAFSVSLLAFWVKGSITVDNNFLRINMPNTVCFGLIPAGKVKNSTPLSAVSNVYTSSSYKMANILIGIAIAFAGLSMGVSMNSIIMIAIGLLVAASGIKTSFCYERNGIAQTIEVPFFEAHHISELDEELNNMLAAYQDDRNNRMQTEKVMAQNERMMAQNMNSSQAIVNAINKSNNNAAASESNAATFCPSCGSKVPAGSAFCTHCGAKLN